MNCSTVKVGGKCILLKKGKQNGDHYTRTQYYSLPMYHWKTNIVENYHH
jgi:hypothetical protein